MWRLNKKSIGCTMLLIRKEVSSNTLVKVIPRILLSIREKKEWFCPIKNKYIVKRFPWLVIRRRLISLMECLSIRFRTVRGCSSERQEVGTGKVRFFRGTPLPRLDLGRQFHNRYHLETPTSCSTCTYAYRSYFDFHLIGIFEETGNTGRFAIGIVTVSSNI